MTILELLKIFYCIFIGEKANSLSATITGLVEAGFEPRLVSFQRSCLLCLIGALRIHHFQLFLDNFMFLLTILWSIFWKTDNCLKCSLGGKLHESRQNFFFWHGSILFPIIYSQQLEWCLDHCVCLTNICWIGESINNILLGVLLPSKLCLWGLLKYTSKGGTSSNSCYSLNKWRISM